MKIALICFTENGFQMEKRLVKLLEAEGHGPCPWVSGRYAMQAASLDHEISFSPVKEGGLSAWAGERFGDSDGLIFIGACGIAVRAIAPYIRDKKTDPAVLAADEKGRFVIPLLSGHLGGANELAERLAEGLAKNGIPAQAVLTTATDVNRRFAVDVFAKEHGLVLDQMKLAKEISAAVLAGEPVGLFSDFPFSGPVPEGLYKDRICPQNIRITVWRKERRGPEGPGPLRLVPRCVVLGTGCKRGTSMEQIWSVAEEAMEREGLDPSAVCGLASIDLKSGEPGLCSLAEKLGVPFFTYTGEELAAVPGAFTESEFVRQVTGVGRVCERAAVAACREASEDTRLLMKKYARDGVTVAAACFIPELFKGSER